MSTDDYVKIVLSTSISFAIIFVAINLGLFLIRFSKLFVVLQKFVFELGKLSESLRSLVNLGELLKTPTKLFDLINSPQKKSKAKKD